MLRTALDLIGFIVSSPFCAITRKEQTRPTHHKCDTNRMPKVEQRTCACLALVCDHDCRFQMNRTLDHVCQQVRVGGGSTKNLKQFKTTGI